MTHHYIIYFTARVITSSFRNSFIGNEQSYLGHILKLDVYSFQVITSNYLLLMRSSSFVFYVSTSLMRASCCIFPKFHSKPYVCVYIYICSMYHQDLLTIYIDRCGLVCCLFLLFYTLKRLQSCSVTPHFYSSYSECAGVFSSMEAVILSNI